MQIEFTIAGDPQGQGRPRFARQGKFVHTYDPPKSPDTDNIEKGVYDALNALAYEDDRQIVMTNTVKVYGPEAKVDVVIEELE